MSKTAPQENFEPLPPVGGIVKWVEAEKADVLRQLPAEQLRELRERVLLMIGEKLETKALRSVDVIAEIMESSEKDETRLKAADRLLSFFDKQGPAVAVQVNNRPQFHSHLGLPAAPPMPMAVTVTPEPEPKYEQAPRPEPRPETWVLEEPDIAKVP